MGDRDRYALADSGSTEMLALREEAEFRALAEGDVHVFRGHVCDTERLGFATPRNRSPLEIIVDASDGFIPLWDENVTLRWRFQERSLIRYANPGAVKESVRALLNQAVAAWGESAPVRFNEQLEGWDFEIAVKDADSCNPLGCTLARAFFPDGGQHELVIYPLMFTQDPQEQLETMVHEIGHIFGLRHFFALTDETAWDAELFGSHREISIMNYGDNSRLTDTDRADLKFLYELAWSRKLKNINRTPIRLMKPFSSHRP